MLNRNFLLFSFISIIIFLLITGCVSTGLGTTKISKAPSINFEDYDYITVDVRSNIDIQNETLVNLEALVVGKLRNLNKFKAVYGKTVFPGKDHDLLLDIEVTNAYVVGDTTRALVGALAGRSSLVIDVKVIDYKTKDRKLLASATMEGKSAFGSLLSEDSSDIEATRQLVKQIVNFFISDSS